MSPSWNAKRAQVTAVHLAESAAAIAGALAVVSGVFLIAGGTRLFSAHADRGTLFYGRCCSTSAATCSAGCCSHLALRLAPVSHAAPARELSMMAEGKARCGNAGGPPR